MLLYRPPVGGSRPVPQHGRLTAAGLESGRDDRTVIMDAACKAMDAGAAAAACTDGRTVPTLLQQLVAPAPRSCSQWASSAELLQAATAAGDGSNKPLTVTQTSMIEPGLSVQSPLHGSFVIRRSRC
jgi:hypothetical protein